MIGGYFLAELRLEDLPVVSPSVALATMVEAITLFFLIQLVAYGMVRTYATERSGLPSEFFVKPEDLADVIVARPDLARRGGAAFRETLLNSSL